MVLSFCNWEYIISLYMTIYTPWCHFCSPPLRPAVLLLWVLMEIWMSVEVDCALMLDLFWGEFAQNCFHYTWAEGWIGDSCSWRAVKPRKSCVDISLSNKSRITRCSLPGFKNRHLGHEYIYRSLRARSDNTRAHTSEVSQRCRVSRATETHMRLLTNWFIGACKTHWLDIGLLFKLNSLVE